MTLQEQSDYNAIITKVGTIRWDALDKHGPEMEVGTALKWPGCRALYLAVKKELHDKPVPGKTLWYYVGAVGNWGKGGFRISSHTKKLKDGKVPANSATHGVLHVVYSPSAVVRASKPATPKPPKGPDADGWTTV